MMYCVWVLSFVAWVDALPLSNLGGIYKMSALVCFHILALTRGHSLHDNSKLHIVRINVEKMYGIFKLHHNFNELAHDDTIIIISHNDNYVWVFLLKTSFVFW